MSTPERVLQVPLLPPAARGLDVRIAPSGNAWHSAVDDVVEAPVADVRCAPLPASWVWKVFDVAKRDGAAPDRPRHTRWTVSVRPIGLDGWAFLVVGAMALSPDFLPISAAAVGFGKRGWRRAACAALTRAVGRAVVVATAAGVTVLLGIFGRVDVGLELADTALGPSLTELGPGTVLAALAAGVGGMLAYASAPRAPRSVSPSR